MISFCTDDDSLRVLMFEVSIFLIQLDGRKAGEIFSQVLYQGCGLQEVQYNKLVGSTTSTIDKQEGLQGMQEWSYIEIGLRAISIFLFLERL